MNVNEVLILCRNEIKPGSIIYLKAVSNYSEIFLSDGRVLVVPKTLKDLEEKFSGFGFFRTHKSFLVNSNHVVALSLNSENRHVKLSNNHKVAVSRRRQADFRKFMKELGEGILRI